MNEHGFIESLNRYAKSRGYRNLWEMRETLNMRSKGYFFFREYYPFGKVSSYRNSAGDQLYVEHGRVMTWEQLRAELKRTWRPIAHSDVDWYCKYVA